MSASVFGSLGSFSVVFCWKVEFWYYTVDRNRDWSRFRV